ncbi:DUF935 domain-containing protein [Roseibium litorale]|nr:DUF935 domain-containing protein [Roseibium litorale]
MALLDQYGRPVSVPALKAEQGGARVFETRGRNTMHPAAGLTPPGLAAILRESVDGDPERYLALAEDMEERNEHYASVLSTRKRQVSNLQITVEAVSEKAEDVGDADLVREVIERDAFQDELFDVLDAVGKGFSATEILWDTSEGQWRPQRFKWQDPRWFRFDDKDGETLLLRGPDGDEPLKPYGWITHFPKIKSGLPIRGGLARAAAWSFCFKAFTIQDWAIFAEAYGQPVRVGKYGQGASEDDKATLMRAVRSIGTDFAAVMPDSMVVELIQAQLSGSHDLYERRADWLDRQVSKLVLGQTETTDATKGGYATASVHNEVRGDIEDADARQLAATLNRDLTRPLIELNRGKRSKFPRIKIGRVEEEDTDKLVDNVVKLVPLGLKVGMATMRDKLGLPDPDEGEEVLAAQKPEAAPQADPEPTATGKEQHREPVPPAKAQAFRSSPSAAEPDGIDRAIDTLLDDGWRPLVEPVIDGLEDELAGAANLDEARAIMERRLDSLGVTKLADMLARASFAARISGEADEGLH